MYDSRLFLIGSGLFSLGVISYASFVHGSMIVMAVIYSSPDQMIAFFSAFFGNLAIIGIHATVCILGPVLAVIFIRHAFRNPHISRWRRFLWVPALVSGYGLVFYWYFHILRGNHRSF
jgi:hypothetical protein